MNQSIPYSIYALGENALAINFGNKIEELINQRVHAFAKHLKENRKVGWLDIIPAYSSVTIVYDVVEIRKHGASANAQVRKDLEVAMVTCNWEQKGTSRMMRVPVCYDIKMGLDLDRMTNEKGLTIDELVKLHTNRSYHVFMTGFLPGFPYMGTVDARLATPRLQQPRTNVAKGSVGIAGEQTGVYPMESPGGWNVIGRTPVELFDVHRLNPVFLQPGDRVQFVSITIEEFENFDLNKFNPVADES